MRLPQSEANTVCSTAGLLTSKEVMGCNSFKKNPLKTAQRHAVALTYTIRRCRREDYDRSMVGFNEDYVHGSTHYCIYLARQIDSCNVK